MFLTENEKQNIINKVQSMIGEHKLLYLALYGSHLYGTHTPSSDLDVRGIFLPSKNSLYLKEKCEEFNYTTGDQKTKNTADDVDVKIFSIQKFIELVRKGDTNGLDLLFSPTNTDCVIYSDPVLLPIMESVDKILNIRDANAYVGYAIGQAKKYGVKGSRLGVIKQIKEFLDDIICYSDQSKLSDISDEIIKNFEDPSYCFYKTLQNKTPEKEDIKYLVVCGSFHQLNIKLEEFQDRINHAYNEYGNRAELAEKAGGIDWKALSHAVRVLYQCYELYDTGKIVFPIQKKEEVLEIKNGKKSYSEVEEIICEMLEQADEKRNNCQFNYKYNREFILQQLRRLYGED